MLGLISLCEPPLPGTNAGFVGGELLAHIPFFSGKQGRFLCLLHELALEIYFLGDEQQAFLQPKA